MQKLRLAAAGIVTAGLVAGVASLTVNRPAASSPVIAAHVAAAAAYGHSHGLRDAVAVLDLETGAFYGGGSYGSEFATASVMKVMIAARLLVSGQMSGSTAALAGSMIERSEDSAVAALWPRVGGSGLEPWIEAHYGITDLGSANRYAAYWGNTHVTAHGLVLLYRALLRDPKVASWLGYHMHHYQCAAADGTNQCFGVPAATAGAGIKQGWGSHSADNGSDAVVNSTGYVSNDRYAVAFLTEAPSGDHAGGYDRVQGAVVTTMARMAMPGGELDPAA